MSKPSNTLALAQRALTLAGIDHAQDGDTLVAACPACGQDGDATRPLTVSTAYGNAKFVCVHGCDEGAITGAMQSRKSRSRNGSHADPAHAALRAYRVTWSTDKVPKLILPPAPEHVDDLGLRAWLTNVLRLDTSHPVMSAVHEGLRGQDGHVEIRRAGAPPLRFEPAGLLNSARRLGPALEWQLQPTDGELYGFKDEHAKRIAYVVRLLCGASKAPSEAQETASVLGTFIQGAEAIEGYTTHGTSGERYEAAQALRSGDGQHPASRWGQSRYLVDATTGELVMRVCDLQATARMHIGSTLARGWLDARIDNLPGWRRAKLDGHGLPGRAGRQGPHAHFDVYTGPWPVSEAHDAD